MKLVKDARIKLKYQHLITNNFVQVSLLCLSFGSVALSFCCSRCRKSRGRSSLSPFFIYLVKPKSDLRPPYLVNFSSLSSKYEA
jgi:hypothetical protein